MRKQSRAALNLSQGCGILAMTFFCMYILLKSSFSHRKVAKRPVSLGSVSERQDETSLRILRGVIKKYSEKKEWGVVGVRESESDSESDDETMVRFMRSERDRVGLQPGDHVIFRAVPDPHMKGWLLAETIWKAPPEELPGEVKTSATVSKCLAGDVQGVLCCDSERSWGSTSFGA